MSDASYVTSYEDQQLGPCVDQSTQCDLPVPTPPKYNDSVKPHHRKLQKYLTSDQLFERRTHLPYTRTIGRPPSRLKFDSHYSSRPRSLAVADSYPFYTSRSGNLYSDSGYGTVGSRRSKYCYQSSDSPTFSLTPPNSLDYLCVKGERSPAGSVTPNGMNSTKSQGAGVYLNPGFLQVPFPNSQIISYARVAQATSETPVGEGGCRSCRSQNDSATGLSWRRLHMSRAKLKATATTSELLSGFAMVAMVELQINEPTNVPEWLFVMFAICTTVLVAVHIFALMISTYLLPNIDAVSKMAEGGDDLVHESPHERMRGFIELAWAFSTVLGLFLFLVEIAILCWVKFWDYSFAAATAATVIVIPVLIVFVAFAIHFYHSLVVHKCESSSEDMVQLESMKRNLDSATIKAGSPV